MHIPYFDLVSVHDNAKKKKEKKKKKKKIYLSGQARKPFNSHDWPRQNFSSQYSIQYQVCK